MGAYACNRPAARLHYCYPEVASCGLTPLAGHTHSKQAKNQLPGVGRRKSPVVHLMPDTSSAICPWLQDFAVQNMILNCNC